MLWAALAPKGAVTTLANAMGKPRAALVATALWMGTLHQVMNGTLMKPPPAPTKPETNPMPPPAPHWPQVPGMVRLGAGFLSSNIWVAENPTNRANTQAKACPL